MECAVEGQLVITVVSVMNSDWCFPQQLAAHGVEGEHKPPFAGGEYHRAPGNRGIDGRDLEIPIMKVVGEGLVIPFQLTRRLIELDDTIRVQFATGGRLRLLEREIG